MKEKIVLIGGGGHCKVVIDAIRALGKYEIEGIVDPDLQAGSTMLDVPVLGADDLLAGLPEKEVRNAFISVGSLGDATLRNELYNKAKDAGFKFPVIIHPKAVVSDDVKMNIGEGTFIAASVTVNAGNEIGRNVILNTASSIDHDCRIGDFVHIAPGAKLSGGVEVGEGSHIGIGAVVIQYKKIGKKCFVKAKELVYRDLVDGETWPADKMDIYNPEYKDVFVIAEAGVNHNGDMELARKLINIAVDAGADAIKFQSFKTENVVSNNAPKAEYQKEVSGFAESQVEMLKRYELDEDAHKALIAHCRAKGIKFMSTPFDIESVDMLNRLGLEVFKIPSGEITNLPYLRKIGALRKKVILSTGMSTLNEVGSALDVLIKAGTPRDSIIILHCNSAYPAPPEEANLKAMIAIKDSFRVGVGYSDHTLGIEVPVAAVAMGAQVIEKHFTIDRGMEGPDHKASLEPRELKDMIKAIRNVQKALGDGKKTPALSEIKNKDVVRKSLVAEHKIRKGEAFTEKNVAIKRPAKGISPMEWDNVIGSKAKRDFKKDEFIEL